MSVLDTCYVGCTPPTTVPSITPTTLGGGGTGGSSVHLATQSLPFTGADVMELLVIGVVLLAIGLAMVLRRRKHVTPTP